MQLQILGQKVSIYIVETKKDNNRDKTRIKDETQAVEQQEVARQQEVAVYSKTTLK